MPRHSFEPVFKKCGGRLQPALSTSVHRDSSQVHLVSVPHRTDSARREPDRFCKPPPIVLRRDCAPVTQHPEKSPLQRRQCHKRSVQIEERRDPTALFLYFLFLLYLLCFLHIASCAALFVPRAGLTLPAMYFHPSTSTGNPRTRQKAAVIHVSVCAAVRIIICASAVSSPISATGPRVNASSNPK